MSTGGIVKRLSIACSAFVLAAAGALAAVPGWQADQRLTRHGAESTTSINFARSIAADERGRLHVVWIDHRDGNPKAFYQRSLDAGKSWGPPIRLTNDAGLAFNPSVAVAGEGVHVAWQDNRADQAGVFYRRSTNGGISWQPEGTIALWGAGSPSVAVTENTVHIVYGRPVGPDESDLFFVRSLDDGASWQAERRISDMPFSSWTPTIAAARRHVDIAVSNAEIDHKRLPGRAVEVGNGLIAFARGVQGSAQIFTIRPDGTGERQLTFEGDNQHPAWSKDGSRLLFSSRRHGFSHLWVMEPDGSNQVAVTSGPVNDFTPDWSYDGTRIAFASVRGGAMQPEIWIMNADGSDPSRLTFAPPGTFGSVHPSFAPGDQAIYFGSGMDGSAQVWGMLPDGQGLERKTAGLGPGFPDANVPEWSRDGLLTFWSGIEGQFGEVWSVDIAAGTGPMKLTETPDPLNSDNPAWSPDGSKILFDSNRGGSISVWIMNADGSAPRKLLPRAAGQTAWQPVIASAEPGCPETLGNGRFCSACGPCAAGEGDCDNDGECQAGLRCVDNIGGSFGFAPGVDVCLVQGGNPPPPGSCPLQAGNGRFCTDCGPCGDGEGDCDNDGECQAGLHCVDNVGGSFGFAPGVDVCLAQGGACPVSEGAGNFCDVCGPCGHGQGDCDRDSDCLPGLVCSDNIGALFGFAPGVDVCVPGTT